MQDVAFPYYPEDLFQEDSISPTANRIVGIQKQEGLYFSFPYNPELVGLIKATFNYSRWHPPEKRWYIAFLDNNIRLLPDFARQHGFVISLNAGNALHEYLVRQEKVLAVPQFLNYGLRPALPFQEVGIRFMAENKKVLQADDMGLGKTFQSIATVVNLNAFPCIVVCKSSHLYNWENEIKLAFPERDCNILHDRDKEVSADFTLISYDMVGDYQSLLQWSLPMTLICDEAHVVKNFRSQRYKSVKRISEGVPYRFLLSGTPFKNRPAELMPLLEILGRLDSEFGGFEGFAHRYCDAMRHRFGLDYKGSSNLEELNTKLLAKCMIRRLKDQVLLELPAKIRHRIEVNIDNGSEYYLAALKLTHFRDGLQHQEGLAYIDSLRLLVAKGKLHALFAQLDSVNEKEPVLVFAYHKEILKAIKERYNCPVIDGGVSSKKRNDIQVNFQAGKYPILALNLEAGGEGFNFTRAANVYFIELDWTPKLLEQAEDRAWRMGQTNIVNCYYFIAPKTIDDAFWSLVNYKRSLINLSTDFHLSEEQELLSLLNNHYQSAA